MLLDSTVSLGFSSELAMHTTARVSEPSILLDKLYGVKEKIAINAFPKYQSYLWA